MYTSKGVAEDEVFVRLQLLWRRCLGDGQLGRLNLEPPLDGMVGVYTVMSVPSLLAKYWCKSRAGAGRCGRPG